MFLRPQVNNGGCTHACIRVASGGARCSCPAGLRLDAGGKACDDVDECVQGDNGGCTDVCVNLVGGYECRCHPGYRTAENDSRSCVDVDECATAGNGGCAHVCVNTVGSYRCECPAGRESRNGSCLPPLDPCRHRNGGCEQLCDATSDGDGDGGAVCSCRPGYRVDRHDASRCRDVDECEEEEESGCDQICVNLPGSYECRCEEGFRMVNSSCVGEYDFSLYNIIIFLVNL